jgi:hypothetical protein
LNFRLQCCNTDAALRRRMGRYLTNAANIARNKKQRRRVAPLLLPDFSNPGDRGMYFTCDQPM